jgi:hypothetical protein
MESEMERTYAQDPDRPAYACARAEGRPAFMLEAHRTEDDESPTGEAYDVDVYTLRGGEWEPEGLGGVFWDYRSAYEALRDVGPMAAAGLYGPVADFGMVPREVGRAIMGCDWPLAGAMLSGGPSTEACTGRGLEAARAVLEESTAPGNPPRRRLEDLDAAVVARADVVVPGSVNLPALVDAWVSSYKEAYDEMARAGEITPDQAEAASRQLERAVRRQFGDDIPSGTLWSQPLPGGGRMTLRESNAPSGMEMCYTDPSGEDHAAAVDPAAFAMGTVAPARPRGLEQTAAMARAAAGGAAAAGARKSMD